MIRDMTTQGAAPRPLYGWAQPTVATGWTADMLERLPADGWHYELVEGTVLRMPPPGTDHGSLEARLARRLGNYVEEHGLGETYVGESGWDLTQPGEVADTVLGADVAFVAAARLPLPPPRRGSAYRPLAPDLVVEIASPSQYRPEMGDKAQQWLLRGVRMVWVVWPERQAIDVWVRDAAEPQTLGAADQLDGADVVPGFRLAVGDLFR
jgi:Uma2 family endonuclease